MKRIFMALFLVCALAIATPALAGDKIITIGFDHPTTPPEADLAGWRVFTGTTSGNLDTVMGDIVYDGTLPPSGDFPMTSPDGITTTHYFAVASFDTSGNVSGLSPEVSADIDFEAPGIPVNVTITVSPAP